MMQIRTVVDRSESPGGSVAAYQVSAYCETYRRYLGRPGELRQTRPEEEWRGTGVPHPNGSSPRLGTESVAVRKHG